MQFTDIIGQTEVKQQLTELVQHNRLSHALLFLGKEGNGALPLALAFAQYVVCGKVNSRESLVGLAPRSVSEGGSQESGVIHRIEELLALSDKELKSKKITHILMIKFLHQSGMHIMPWRL